MLQNFNFAEKKPENMLHKLIAFSLLLATAISCTKTKDVIDYGPIDKKIIQDYLVAKGVTNADSTASGLYYIIQKSGGTTHPTLNSVVTVNYKGYLVDGTVFDSSTAGNPIEFPLYRLIYGWQEGLPLIGAGGKMTLFVPSALGYGATPTGKIPANSVLIFDLELVSFK